MIFIKDGIKKKYEVQENKILCTIQIDGRWVSNPTIEQFKAQGWEEYTPPVVEPQPYVPSYEELVAMKIRERYTVDPKPDEFAEHNDFCEQCKAEARSEVENFM